METQKTITIDLAQPGQNHQVCAVQRDSGAWAVQLLLCNGDRERVVPEGVTASVIYSKTDGTAGWYDTLPDGTKAYAVNGSSVTVTLAPQMMTSAGSVWVEEQVTYTAMMTDTLLEV